MIAKRRMNRREFLRLSSMVGVTALAAACAPAAVPSAPGQEEAAAPVQEVVKIRYQSREPETAAGVQQLWKEFYPQFQAAHPEIEVEFLPQPGGDIRENAVAQMVAGNAPDLLEFCCQNSTYFVQVGETLDLQPYIDRDAAEINMDDYYAHQFDPWVDEAGNIHLMPRFTGTQLIYFNKDMFDEMGVDYPPQEWGAWNWELYREIGGKFVKTEQPARYGSANYGMNANWLTQYWMRLFGGNMVDPEDNTRCGLGDQPCQEGLEWIRQIIWEDHMFAPQAQAAGSGLGPLELFLGERVAMMEMGPWNLGPTADGARFKWDVAPMPDGPGGSNTHQSVDGTMIWKKTQHPEESWTLLKALTSPEYGRLYARWATKQPSRKSVLKDFVDILRDQNPIYQEVKLEVFTDSLAGDIGGPEEMFKKDFPTKSEILTPAFDKVMMLGEAPIDYIVAHAEVATKFNRDEISVEDLGNELAKIRG